MGAEGQPPAADGYALEPPDEPPPAAVRNDVFCRRCGYDLRGLAESGLCPECATPVATSLRGNLLRYSDERYLATLHRGVVLILVAVAVQLVLSILGLAPRFLRLMPGASVPAVVLIGPYGSTAVSLLLLLGWWMFSATDPAFVGSDRGTTARLVVRVAVIAEAALTALDGLHDTGAWAAGNQSMQHLAMAAKGATFLAFAVRFFASMLYLRWLAPRLPNPHVGARAGKLMWLGPLLYTVGWFVCVGPLVAIVLYWNMLDWVRKDIRRIREEQAGDRARGPGLAGA